MQIMEMVENLRVKADLAVLSMSYCSSCRLVPLAARDSARGLVPRMQNYTLLTVRFANLGGDALAGSSHVVKLGIF